MRVVPGEFYAGHKAAETPRRAYVDGGWIEVTEVLSRRRVSVAGSGMIVDLFRCRLADGRIGVVGSEVPWPKPSPAAGDSTFQVEMDEAFLKG